MNPEAFHQHFTHPTSARSMRAMNAWEPIAAEDAVVCPQTAAIEAFSLRRAAAEGEPPPTPLVFASPHSGSVYPEEMMAAAALDAHAIRRSEDALVDGLIAATPELGAALITA